jgi:DNA repair exonuclease SbcCD ATPase subunit
MSEPDAVSNPIEALTDRAVECSILVADLFDKRDPTAVNLFNEFVQLATEALDLYEAKLGQMKASRNSFMDQVSDKLARLQKATEMVTRYRNRCANATKAGAAVQQEITELTQKKDQLIADLARSASLRIELEQVTQSCRDIEREFPVRVSEISSKKVQQTNLLAQIEELSKNSIEAHEAVKRRIRKNQMKANELQAMIRRWAARPKASESPVSSPPPPTAEPRRKRGPSLIIHQTEDEDTDHLRTLRSAMEEALKQNRALKNQVRNRRQDLAAMHEENSSLKEIMRLHMADADT